MKVSKYDGFNIPRWHHCKNLQSRSQKNHSHPLKMEIKVKNRLLYVIRYVRMQLKTSFLCMPKVFTEPGMPTEVDDVPK